MCYYVRPQMTDADKGLLADRRYDVKAWSQFEPHQLAAIEPAVICRLLRFAAGEITTLREELIGMTEEAFTRMSCYCNQDDDGDRKGWWDTCGLSSAKALGDRLVELGAWERHPDGYGRRWFYRPIQSDPDEGEKDE